MQSVMRTLTLTYRIITPLVMAGMERDSAELRAASIKGTLRWWYRFYKASHCKDLDELRKNEFSIFGSTESASCFSLRIISEPQYSDDAYLCMNDRREEKQGGALKNYSKITRRSFSPGQQFILRLNFFSIHEDKLSEVKTALIMLSFFGGIGARWRRGFGSIMIEQDNNRLEEQSLDRLAQNIRNRLRSIIGGFKDLNGFMNLGNTELFLIKHKNGFWNKWCEAMNHLRDNFYRELKKTLGVRYIAVRGPIRGSREVSPLIIQIKQVHNGDYFGVVLVWKNWDRYKYFALLQRYL